jgi:ketosteroid isomerase-like protein
LSQENVEIVKGLFAAWEQRDGDSAKKLLAADVKWDASDFPWPDLRGTYFGSEGVDAFWRSLLTEFETWEFRPHHFVDIGDQVFVLLDMGGRGRQSGAVAFQHCVAVYTLRSGLVTNFGAFQTLAAAAAAVGV